MGIRTPDIQLAKLALYQLSYTPCCRGIPLSRGCGLTRKKTELRAAFRFPDRAEYKISVIGVRTRVPTSPSWLAAFRISAFSFSSRGLDLPQGSC